MSYSIGGLGLVVVTQDQRNGGRRPWLPDQHRRSWASDSDRVLHRYRRRLCAGTTRYLQPALIIDADSLFAPNVIRV